jgi:hypothetical protein
MRKSKLLFLMMVTLLPACNCNKEKNEKNVNVPIINKIDTHIVDKSIPSTKSNLQQRLNGVWIIKDSETGNANFLLKDSLIYYPETNSSYYFKIVGDTLVVKYDDYIQHLHFKFHGNDTLVLNGEDGPNTFLRVKK